MLALPDELRAYHETGGALVCELDVEPWRCEFWPLADVERWNVEYGVGEMAPGYLGFATSGGGEMYAVSPRGTIVCLAFIGMSPAEELYIAPSWDSFTGMLRGAV
jgi:SMI1/KNR4 family protein SUKH-1